MPRPRVPTPGDARSALRLDRLRDWLPPAEQEVETAGAQIEPFRASRAARIGWTVLAVVVLIGALLTGIFQFWTLARQHEVRDKITIAEQPHTLVVSDAGSGDVTVIGEVGATEIVLERELRTASDQPSPDVTTEDGRTTIGSWCGPSPCSGSLVIRVPAGTDVQVESGSGDLSIEGVTGTVAAHSGSGDVTVTGTEGPVDASATSGDVSIEDAGGPLTLSTTSGSIEISTATLAAATVTASSGDVTVTATSDIDTLKVETSSGDVSVDVPNGRTYRLDVPSDSEVSVPTDPGAARLITVGTGSGDVTIE